MTTTSPRARTSRLPHLVNFQFIDDGVTTAGQFRAGPAPTVVVVPAMGQTSADWDGALQSAGPAAVWSFDRPGVGRRTPARPHRDPMSYCAFADELDTTLAASLATGPYVLVGHSLGALIALAYTQMRPTQVAGVVLVDPSLPHMDLGGPDLEPKIDGDDDTGSPIDADTDADLVAGAAVPGVPAVVLSRTPGWPDYIPADEDTRWHSWHADLAARWGAPRLVTNDSGHQMQREAPAVVGYAIGQVVQAVREGRRTVEVSPADAIALNVTVVD